LLLHDPQTSFRQSTKAHEPMHSHRKTLDPRSFDLSTQSYWKLREARKLLQLAGKTQTIPFIGVGAFFFISLVLYLANPLHPAWKLPFSAHIETHGSHLPLLVIKYAFTTKYQQQENPTKIYPIYFFTIFPPSLCRLEAYNKIVSAGHRFLFRRSWSTLLGCRSWSNLA
jgi:hypothetical protein